MNVLVTGSAKGLGKEIIKTFASNNFNVIIGYKSSIDDANNLLDYIKDNYNVDVYVEKLDITAEEDVKNIFNKYKVDILVNNAALSIDNYIEDKSLDEFMNVLRVNLGGTFLMCKYGKNTNTIINISSTDGIDTFSPISLDYSASKSGLINFSKNLSLYYKDKRIICICPNWINTPSVLEMNPQYLSSELKRIGQRKLLDQEYVAQRIFEIYKDKNIKSGSVVRIDE